MADFFRTIPESKEISGWKPGWWELTKTYLTSSYFRASLQLASGQFIICLFVFIERLRFSAACLASIFFFIGIILRQDQHVASFLMSANKTAGCLIAGATSAGVVLQLAHLPGYGFPGFVCLFAVLGIFIMSTVRATADIGTGLISSVVFGITLIQSEFIPANAIWTLGIVPFYYAGLVTALAEIFAGSLVLPSLARRDLRMTTSLLIQGIGHSMSAYGSHVLRPDSSSSGASSQKWPPAHSDPASPVNNTGKGNASGSAPQWSRVTLADSLKGSSNKCIRSQLRMDSDCDEAEDTYWTFLQEVSKPEGSLEPVVTPSLSSHRPLLATARRLIGEAAFEPPWIDSCAMDLDKWSTLVDSLRKLALRSAALESLLEGEEQVIIASELQALLGVDVMPIFEILFGQMAASCATMAAALRDAACGNQRQGHMRLLLEPSYATLEFELASALHCIISSYWRRMQVAKPRGTTGFRPEVQVRIVLYLGALCSGVLEMLAETEKAAIAAVASPERRRQPLLLLVSRARRSVEEKLEDRELKAAMSHKKAIDSSLHRILTSVSVHAGAGKTMGGGSVAGEWSTLYEGKSQRPLQVQPSNHLMSRSMSAAAVAPASFVQEAGSSYDSPQQQISARSEPPNAARSDQQAQSALGSPAQQDRRSKEPAGPQQAEAGTRGRVQWSEEASSVIPKSASAEGFLNKEAFLNRFLLTTRPSAARDPVRRRAAVAATAAVSHQVTQLELGLPKAVQLLPDGQLPPPPHPTVAAGATVTHQVSHLDCSLREAAQPPKDAQILPSRAAGSGAAVPVLSPTGPGLLEGLPGSNEGAGQSSEDEEDDLLALGMLPSEEFVRNWNQHTSFHRRKQEQEKQEQGQQQAPGGHADHSKRPTADRDLESFDSLSLESDAGHGHDGSKQTDDKQGSGGGATSAKASKGSKEAGDYSSRKEKDVRAGAGWQWIKSVEQWIKAELGWVWPLLVLLSGYAVWKAAFVAYTQTVPQSRPSWTDKHWWRKNRRLQFFLKFFGASASVLCLILSASYYSPGFHSWVPLYAMTTVAVVLSEKIDTTVSKGVLRVAGTAIGGTIGFLVMLHSDLATNPYALITLVCLMTAVVAPITLTVYKYAVFLMLITFDSLILCQYSPKPGNTGSPVLYYARVVHITVGVLIVLAIELVLPWYTSVASLETLGQAYRQGTELIGHYYEAYLKEAELAADPKAVADAQDGVQILEKDLLIKKMAQPLSDVQMSLERETVLWKRGLLVMPKIVRDTLSGLQALQDRLAAVELMLLQKPIVSGRYTGHAYKNFLLPLDKGFRKVCARALELGNMVEEVLSEEAEPRHLAQLQTAIDNLQSARVKLRRQYVQKQHEFAFAMQRDTEPHMIERSPDDALRYQSVMFALIRALDKCVLVARMVLQDEFIVAHITAGRWEHRRLWLDLPGDEQKRNRATQSKKDKAAAADVEMGKL